MFGCLHSSYGLNGFELRPSDTDSSSLSAASRRRCLRCLCRPRCTEYRIRDETVSSLDRSDYSVGPSIPLLSSRGSLHLQRLSWQGANWDLVIVSVLESTSIVVEQLVSDESISFSRCSLLRPDSSILPSPPSSHWWIRSVIKLLPSTVLRCVRSTACSAITGSTARTRLGSQFPQPICCWRIVTTHTLAFVWAIQGPLQFHRLGNWQLPWRRKAVSGSCTLKKKFEPGAPPPAPPALTLTSLALHSALLHLSLPLYLPCYFLCFRTSLSFLPRGNLPLLFPVIAVHSLRRMHCRVSLSASNISES